MLKKIYSELSYWAGIIAVIVIFLLSELEPDRT